MPDLSKTGGARIGWLNASWPLARLTVSSTRLALSALFLGKYEFAPEQIVSFEPYGSIPVLQNGNRLNHNRPDYPAKLVFWTMGNRARVLDGIRTAGFEPKGPVASLIRTRGFPLRWDAAVVLLLIWNIPFLLGWSALGPLRTGPSPIMLFPLLAAFILSWATLKSARVQRLILREGHFVDEIRSILLLIRFVSGLIFAVFLMILLAQPLPSV